MKTENPLLIVEDLLNTARPAKPGAYALIVSRGIIDLVKHRDIPPECMIITHLTSDHINKGLNSALWNHLDGLLRRFKKTGLFTPPTSQPLLKGL